MDINLWMAGKNYLKGEWLKIFEVTPYLLHTIAPTADEKSTASAVLQAQVASTFIRIREFIRSST